MAQPVWFRKCVGCGTVRHKNELLRIVKHADFSLVIDSEQKQPGRGAYICPQLVCAEMARKRRGLEKSFRRQIDSRFYDELIKEIKTIESR